MTRRPTLILFAKAPRLGAVKTRLARDIGRDAAWRFYRDATARLARRIGGDPRWRTVLAVSPDGFAKRGRFWSAAIPRVAQGQGNLGRRMARAISRRGGGPVVLVGSDIPGVMPDRIAQAFTALRRADAVFGPAEDGGFWLVGFRRAGGARAAFRGVRWSSEHTLADTLFDFRGRKVAFAATLADVDTGADFARYSKTGSASRRATMPSRPALGAG